MLLSLLVLLCWRSPDPVVVVTGFRAATRTIIYKKSTAYARRKQAAVAGESLPFSFSLPLSQCLSLLSKSMTMSSLGSSSSNHDQSSSSRNTDDTMDPILRRKCAAIRVIASDVDGTILGGPTPHSLHPRTKQAILHAVEDAYGTSSTSSATEAEVAATTNTTTSTKSSLCDRKRTLEHFFVATGKTRAGVLASVGPDLAARLAHCPGVYIQGVYCLDRDGAIVYEQKLAQDVLQATEQVIADLNRKNTKESHYSLIAYDGDQLYTTECTPSVRDLHEKYGEPLAKSIPSLADYTPGIHKLLICLDDPELLTRQCRPALEQLSTTYDCVITQAVPTMLEVLPGGCSKAVGVQKLCEALFRPTTTNPNNDDTTTETTTTAFDPAVHLFAIGDAENDADLLRMAAVGVCVGNGSDLAKQAADLVLAETNSEGGAGVAIELGMNTRRGV